MASPTRFTNGVTNVAKSSTMGNYVANDPTKVHSYFNDFDTYAAADWVVTETGNATQALADADGGVLLITNAALDNDASFSQKVGESFLMEAGKKAWFKARFKVSDATESDVVIGLQVLDTTPLDATDGIYFVKVDGSTTITAVCRKDATTGSTSVTAGTLANDTFITLGWYYNGSAEVQVFVNDAMVASLDASSTYLPDTELTVSFGIQNGNAVARTMTLDYIMAAKERG